MRGVGVASAAKPTHGSPIRRTPPPAEAVNDWLASKLAGRARYLGNRQRTIKLLDLLTVGYNHRADERAFAAEILERHHGRPQSHQREFDDINHTPSLYT